MPGCGRLRAGGTAQPMGLRGRRGGCARGAAAGMDAGRMSGPAPRPSEAGGGALQQSGLMLPRGAAGTEFCRLRASLCGRTDKAEQQQQPPLCAAPFLYLVRDGAFPTTTHTTRWHLAPNPFSRVFLLTCWKTGSEQLSSFIFVATIIGVWWES